MESKVVYIYGLWDPRTLELRYIGKSDNPESRLRNHIWRAKRERGHNSHKDHWIKQLLSEGLEPAIEILEECNEETWEGIEKVWIAEAKEKGVSLTNISEGGDGFGSGEKHPFFRKEVPQARREHQSRVMLGRSLPKPEGYGEKMRAIILGKKHTEETKAKMSLAQQGAKNHFYGKNHTEETRERMRKPHGKMSKEHCEKLSTIRKGRIFPESGKLKSSLSHLMLSAKKRGDIQKISELQGQYFELCGEYNKKYPIPRSIEGDN